MSLQLRNAVLNTLDELFTVHEPFERLRENLNAMADSIETEIHLRLRDVGVDNSK